MTENIMQTTGTGSSWFGCYLTMTMNLTMVGSDILVIKGKYCSWESLVAQGLTMFYCKSQVPLLCRNMRKKVQNAVKLKREALPDKMHDVTKRGPGWKLTFAHLRN